MITIVVVNASKVLTDAALRAYIPVMQSFDNEVLAPAWNLAPCEYVFDTWASFRKQRPNGPVGVDDVWPIFVNNRSDTAGALGWHDGMWQGRPIVFGRVFAGDCIKYKADWRTDLSHEAFEIRGNPHIDRVIRISNDSLGREREALGELCDPIEDDLYAIRWRKSRVSNILLPSYFSGDEGPWDYGEDLEGPCPAIKSGGYQTLRIVGQPWTQVLQRKKDGRLPYRLTQPGRSFSLMGGTR